MVQVDQDEKWAFMSKMGQVNDSDGACVRDPEYGPR